MSYEACGIILEGLRIFSLTRLPLTSISPQPFFLTPTILSGLYSSDRGNSFQRLYFNCLSTQVSTIRVGMVTSFSNDMHTIICQVPPLTGDQSIS